MMWVAEGVNLSAICILRVYTSNNVWIAQGSIPGSGWLFTAGMKMPWTYTFRARTVRQSPLRISNSPS